MSAGVPWRFDEVAAGALAGRTLAATWPAPGGTLSLHFAAVAPPPYFDAGIFERHGIVYPPRVRQAVPKRQAEYFAGRLCARAALAAQGSAETQVGTGALAAPVWPAGFTGSISHAGMLAVATVVPGARCRGIGIDLEALPDDAGLEALRAVALNGAERDRIATVARDPETEALLTTLVFSAKESFFKATAAHVGRYFEFSAIECTRIGTDAVTCVIREALAPELVPGTVCRFDAAHGGRHVLTSYRW